MKEKDEMELHRKMQEIEGKYEVKTDWGKIVITLDAIPNYAGGEGRPDEILVVKLDFAILGTDVKLSVPVLIEVATKGGWSGDAKVDLEKFCERTISGEQQSYLEISMIVVGGDSYKKLESKKGQLTTRFNITQVPKRMIT
ncbi:MAG: hypothetical protein DDT40_01789 [candidate division WS2 bacterium]|nr:hypothetical protein [Candidatus Psychracetigena formicireducens]